MTAPTTTIIAIVGMPGSGKSEAAAYFKSQTIPVLRFGDITDEGVRAQGKPLTEETERVFREGIRKELGMAAMAIQLAPKIAEATQNAHTIVLDGLYSLEEYTYLKQRYPQLLLLHIHASPTVRYERLVSRSVRSLTRELAIARDFAELTHLNKGGPIALADTVIINEGSKEDFIQKLSEFLHTLPA